MYIRPTSNAAAAAKIGNPEGCFLAGWAALLPSHRALGPCSFVAPCQLPARKQRAHPLFMRWVLVKTSRAAALSKTFLR